jgi:hypothetical protein
MTEEKSTSLSKLSYAIATYGIVSSVLYLFGYWSTFDINILEYTSLADVAKLAIYPVTFIVVSSSLGVVLTNIVTGELFKSKSAKGKISFGESPTFWRVFLTVVLVLSSSILYFLKFSSRWYLVTVILGVFFSLLLDHSDLLKGTIEHSGVRTFIILTLVLLPLLSFSTGKVKALKILNNEDVRYVNIVSFREPKLLAGQVRLKYLGTTGDYFFFASENNAKVYTVKYSDLYMLETYK